MSRINVQGGDHAAGPADRLGAATRRAARAVKRRASAVEDTAGGEVSSEPKRRRGRPRKQVQHPGRSTRARHAGCFDAASCHV